MILGEKMPDKNDPQYKERYEKDVEAGRKFAKATRIDRLAGHIQRFADRHSKLFLAIVFGIVIGCLAVNVYHMTRAYSARQEQKTATEMQEQLLREKLNKSHTLKPSDYGTTEQD